MGVFIRKAMFQPLSIGRATVSLQWPALIMRFVFARIISTVHNTSITFCILTLRGTYNETNCVMHFKFVRLRIVSLIMTTITDILADGVSLIMALMRIGFCCYKSLHTARGVQSMLTMKHDASLKK
jgi:hypothetical protein